MVCGIDEAGRGPVLGPLVVAGVATDHADILADLGVRDSKRLPAGRREHLARIIQEDVRFKVAIRVIDAATLDQEMANTSLNDIELARFAEVAAELDDASVIADAADVDADRFAKRLARRLPDEWSVQAEHQADDRHVEVAAASIIAKTTRDAAIQSLARRLERRLPAPHALGSGYPGDAVTKSFLAAWMEAFGDLPPESRRSWKTSRDLLAAHQTPRLESFGDND